MLAMKVLKQEKHWVKAWTTTRAEEMKGSVALALLVLMYIKYFLKIDRWKTASYFTNGVN